MKSQPTAVRIPESMGPAEIGPYLRSLREQFRLSVQDVSERLHIRVRYVQAIEDAQYENMPGKVYARGYVHTYAEFLGLDPEQVAEQCFPPAQPVVVDEAQPAAKPIMPTPYVLKNFVSPAVQKKMPVKWIGAGVAAVVLLVLVSTVFSGHETADVEEASGSVAPVPEALLASVRSEVMPTAQNYECLMETTLLDCFYAQRDVQQLAVWQAEAVRPFEADMEVALADAKEAAANAAATAEKAAEPEASTGPSSHSSEASHESD